ncbi:MAG: archease [Candidatus Aenigmarchaeota archaeon]|nr:archease [Candidatus Aenigmarchaeota archaeon]
MPFKIREDVATADVAFEAEGESFEKLCEAAGDATTSVMINPATLKEKKRKRFSVKGETPEKLLINFLNEIIFIKDAGQMVFKSYKVSIKNNVLTCVARGDVLNFKKQEHRVDVKAATYHMFKVAHEKNKWKAFVILDI